VGVERCAINRATLMASKLEALGADFDLTEEFMRDIIAPVLASLVVLYALAVLVSADRTPSGLGLLKNQERISDLGTQLIELLIQHERRQQQAKDAPRVLNAERTMKVQQALRDNGFYSGPVDGVMREKTQEAILSFQQSRHLNLTGTIDEETARELGIH
jgi:hypothetical protein